MVRGGYMMIAVLCDGRGGAAVGGSAGLGEVCARASGAAV